jgi:histidinol dehydrogenase
MKINRYDWKSMDRDAREKLLSRSETDISEVRDAVEKIIRRVRDEGDGALKDYNHKFDGTPVSMELRVSRQEWDEAESLISDEVKEALEYSIDNIRRFHLTQKPEAMSMVEIRPGMLAGEKAMPIESAGLYVPRGRGNFPSMLYMLAVPAQVAGVDRIAVVTPPDSEGKVDPACLYAAKLCGVDEVYKVGGAHAVAALAYGTESIRPVHKLLGPGSMYVTAAKRILYGQVDVGLPAGPSESIVIADGKADPRKVALDLLIEAEHGSDSAALLITPSEELADGCARYIREFCSELPEPRKSFVEDVMQGYGGIILSASLEEAAEIANLFATEHLQLQTEEPFETLALIRNAGEILLGEDTPFSIANYAVGPNAVLPTGGNARTWSAVSVRDFIKFSSVIYTSPGALKEIAPHVEVLADYEGFTTHGDALRKRR